MVVVAHPDDELLGLGATMHKLIKKYKVNTHVVILGEGLTSRSDKRDPESWRAELEKHKNDIEAAKNEVGYHSVSVHDFPDNRFDTVALLDLIKVIEKEKSEFKPELIFTHHGGDVNIDHQRTFDAVLTACRPMKDEITKTIITFETPSGTEWRASSDPRHFIPNWYMEVSEDDIIAKISGMEKYRFERREYPHPRSPKALKIHARDVGVSVGCKFAERFCLVRSIQS
ncbi:MAG: PIG-L family deacetylase [Bacteroidetes bacterium]|jgi:LmbE family N-acetylglucosaminyl deacetylase|nr:PIG-L family deacetylase [Bacteroidota bacterium]